MPVTYTQYPYRDLSPTYTWRIPLLALLLLHAVIAFKPAWNQYLENENGVIELLTPLVALLAAGYGLMALRWSARLPKKWLRGWLLFAAISCVYYGGEEISWGQQFFNWQTPELWKSINDQQETNLHNTSSWLDQKPQIVVLAGILIGGILYPLSRGRWRAFAPQTLEYWLFPTRAGVPAAMLCWMLHTLDKLNIYPKLGWLFSQTRYSEVVELLIAYFLLLYLMSFAKRARQHWVAAIAIRAKAKA